LDSASRYKGIGEGDREFCEGYSLLRNLRISRETSMSRVRIDIPNDKIADFCRKHHIRTLAFFGSVLREDFQTGSDVDVLVTFERDREPGFMRLARMERELSEMFGRQVDMRTPEDLSRLFRDEVVANAELAYAS